MDAEYNAMRRRMSRLRVKGCGKGAASLEAEDADGGNDPGFKDLIKYWKKHGIPIPDDLLSDMADEKVKQAAARGKGRRRSKELEDLHLCASTGKFNLERIDSNEHLEEVSHHKAPTAKKSVSRMQSDSHLLSSGFRRAKGGSLKKVGSGNCVGSADHSSANGSLSPETKKKLARAISSNK